MRDFDRALNERGRKDAAKIGAYMAHHALFPDRVIVSPARRARETWEHMSKAFSALPPVDYDERLYEGGPDAVLARIDFPVDDWRKVRPRHGRLGVFVSPRSL